MRSPLSCLSSRLNRPSAWSLFSLESCFHPFIFSVASAGPAPGVHVPLVLRSPELGTALQLQLSRAEQRGRIIVSNAFPDAPQEELGLCREPALCPHTKHCLSVLITPHALAGGPAQPSWAGSCLSWQPLCQAWDWWLPVPGTWHSTACPGSVSAVAAGQLHPRACQQHGMSGSGC